MMKRLLLFLVTFALTATPVGADYTIRTSISFVGDRPSLSTMSASLYQPPGRTLVGTWDWGDSLGTPTIAALDTVDVGQVVYLNAPVDTTLTGAWDVEWRYTLPGGGGGEAIIADRIWVFPSQWALNTYLSTIHGSDLWTRP